MDKQQASWSFSNPENPNETIIVHDRHSALCLKALIKESRSSWFLQEGPSLETATAAIIAPTAPVVQAPQSLGSERRTQERFDAEFRVILISGTSSFRTSSRDVSMGGMRLKKSIPPSFIQGNCTVYVSHQDMRENLEMICNVIADPSDPCRIKFLNPDLAQLKRLSEWIEAQKHAE